MRTQYSASEQLDRYESHDPVTDEELAMAEQRAKDSTAGPWHRTGVNVFAYGRPHKCIVRGLMDDAHQRDVRDQVFIAEARTDVPRFVGEIRRLHRVGTHSRCAPTGAGRPRTWGSVINPFKLVISAPLLLFAGILAFICAHTTRHWWWSLLGIGLVCAAVLCWLLLLIYHSPIDT
jgi:hypothetical protein